MSSIRSLAFYGHPFKRRCGVVPYSVRTFLLPTLAAVVIIAASPSQGEEVSEGPGLALVEAVRLALVHDPAIQLVEIQVDTSRGALLSSRGSFDPLLTSDLSGGDTRTPLSGGGSRASESLQTSLGWSQFLRSGQTLEPQITLDRTADATGALNQATVSFALRQPLLRGRSKAVVTAFESAAEHELEAARLDLAHTTAERLRAVVTQYWTVKAAVLDLEILRSTEESSQALLATTRRLIEAHVTPAAELVQLEADLVLREANRIVGERNLFLAVQQLGRELGLTASEIAALASPTDPFPVVELAAVPLDAMNLLAHAQGRRTDLLAAQERLAAEEQRLLVAEDALAPQLDLVLTPSYSGLVDGAGGDDYVSSLWSHVPGLSANFSLSLTLPIRNRTAVGDQIRAQASLRQRELLIEQSRKQIDSRVPAALLTVRKNVERLKKLEQAVGLFERTLENEGKKLRAGTSTLIDVISQRDRLTSALQSRNAAQLALAIALVELRFETGTLIEVGLDDIARVESEDFTTLPF